MPPKKGTKSKSPKLSKAEKERLKKEEAERKAKEEEEARLLAEQEQQEREEKERQEKAEKERLAQQEKEQHEAEVDELNNLLEDKYTLIRNYENKKREDTKWQRYMLCDGSPDPTITKEINTYMSLWREDTAPKPIHKTLQELHDALKLIEELQCYLGDEKDLSEQDIEKHNISITQLQNLIHVKLNEATMHILKNPEEHVDPDTQNIQFETKSRSISLNVWGNIARNPRIKTLSFDKESVIMEVPKSISVGNVAVRFIFTSFDHLSEKCRLFFPRKKKVAEVPPPVIEPQPEEPPAEEMKENDNEDSTPVADTASNLTPKPPSRGRAKSGRKGATTPATGRKSRRKTSRSQVAAVVSSPVDTEPTTDSKEAEQDVVASTPDESLSEKPTVEVRPVSEDLLFDEDDDEDVVDLRAFGTTFRVIYMDFYELPPQAKLVKDWVIQQIVPPKLVSIPYVCELKPNKEEEAVDNEATEADGIEQSESTISKVNSVLNPPLAITMRLPPDVCYFEQPQVARWDPTKSHWRLDGFTDTVFDEKSNILKFKADRFSPIAVFQDLYLNMPFQSWEIRPRGVNSCLLTIVAAAIDVEIEVKDSMCCVSHAEDSVQRLRHLAGQWFQPKDLIKKVKASGVNIFPAVDAEKYVSVNIKEGTLERTIYEQMALTSSSYAYSWSRWNSDCGRDKIVLQSTEQLKDEPSVEDDWFVFLISNENSCRLKISEFDEAFSDDVAENTKLHADLYHMVTDGASEVSKQKIKDTSFEFFHCVLQLLNATKVLTYS